MVCPAALAAQTVIITKQIVNQRYMAAPQKRMTAKFTLWSGSLFASDLDSRTIGVPPLTDTPMVCVQPFVMCANAQPST